MKKKNEEKTFFDCAFGDYTGKSRWIVTHPEYKGELRVAAPDENSAIVAAADRWGDTWTRYGFYAYCTVFKA